MITLSTPHFKSFCDAAIEWLPPREAAVLIGHEYDHKKVAEDLGYHPEFELIIETLPGAIRYDARNVFREPIKEEDLLKILFAPENPSSSDLEKGFKLLLKKHGVRASVTSGSES